VQFERSRVRKNFLTEIFYCKTNQTKKRIFKDPVAEDTRINGTECKAYLNLSFHAGHNHEELINKTFNFSYNPIFYVCRYFALWLLETIFSIIGEFPFFVNSWRHKSGHRTFIEIYESIWLCDIYKYSFCKDESDFDFPDTMVSAWCSMHSSINSFNFLSNYTNGMDTFISTNMAGEKSSQWSC